MANDTWFRGLELKYGPDGAVYLTDWYDTGECHENDADNAHRENGRIYKISLRDSRSRCKVDLAGLDDEALARLQLHQNDWYVRTARRLLQERAAAGRDLGEAHRVLREILAANPDVTRRLRAVWALYVTGGLDEKAALALARSTRASTSGPGASGCSAIWERRHRPRWRGSPSWPGPTPARRSG